MELTLPKKKTKAKKTEPKKLFIFSHPKVGKTSNLAALPNSLIIDMEDSADFYESANINIKKIAKEENKSMLSVLTEVKKKIKESDHVYDFIILDTTTAMEEIARTYATQLYKKSNIGQNFEGTDVVSELPKGGGYEWLRKAFDKIYNAFDMLANKSLILSGHVKNSSIAKEGKELSARDIHLTGKLKMIVGSDVDAVGFMYRNQETTENILSFKTSEQDLFTGSRLPYLSGKDFVISKKKEDGNVETYWNQIFPSISN